MRHHAKALTDVDYANDICLLSNQVQHPPLTTIGGACTEPREPTYGHRSRGRPTPTYVDMLKMLVWKAAKSWPDVWRITMTGNADGGHAYGRPCHMTAVYPGDVFPVSPSHAATWLLELQQ